MNKAIYATTAGLTMRVSKNFMLMYCQGHNVKLAVLGFRLGPEEAELRPLVSYVVFVGGQSTRLTEFWYLSVYLTIVQSACENKRSLVSIRCQRRYKLCRCGLDRRERTCCRKGKNVVMDRAYQQPQPQRKLHGAKAV